MSDTSAPGEVVVSPLAWKTLACVSLVGFMVSVEITIISLALDDIRAAFPGASESALSWIFTSYNIGVAALLLPAGWMSDRFGRRNIFVLGVGLFGIGSLLAGLAPSIELLIVARALQSIGGSLQFPSGLALLLAAFPVEKRQLGIGIWGATGGLAAAVGPTLGAVLVNATDWRAVFLINVPVAVVITVLGSRWLDRDDGDDVPRGADLIGVPVAALGVGAVVLGIVQTESWGWSSPGTIACFVVGVVFVVFFVFRSLNHPTPLFDLSLFKLPSFAYGNLGQIAFVGAFFAWLVPLPTFLRSAWGWSVLEAGFAVSPGPLTAMVVAPIAGRMADRVGVRIPLVIGAVAGVIGIGWQLQFTEVEPDYVMALLIPAILVGIAAGVSFSGCVGAIMSDIEPRFFSMAGAARQTIFQLALALAIAVAFTVIGRPADPTGWLDRIQVCFWIVLALFALQALIFAVLYPKDRGAATDS